MKAFLGTCLLGSSLALLLSLAALAPGCKEEDDGPANATCGKKPLPDCPLQKWMKENMKPALADEDKDKLAKSFETLAAHAPAGFAEWASIAKTGADAASKNDISTVKAQCKSCHDNLRSRFKKEIRDKPLF